MKIKTTHASRLMLLLNIFKGIDNQNICSLRNRDEIGWLFLCNIPSKRVPHLLKKKTVCQNNRNQGSTPVVTLNLCSPWNPQALRLSSKTCGFIPSVFSSSPTKQLRFRPTLTTAKSRNKMMRISADFRLKKKKHMPPFWWEDCGFTKKRKKVCDFRFLDGFPISII